MSTIFVFVAMVFCHIFDDFHLQGILIDMKQKKWWEKQVAELDSTKYKNDYIVALTVHSISWSVMITLPLVVYYGFACSIMYLVILLVNAVIHAVIDDLKANKLVINLVTDQLLHMLQICLTFCVCLICEHI